MENKNATRPPKKAGRKPDFSVKAGGEFVGSAWVNKNKYGKYVSVVINRPVNGGEKISLFLRNGAENPFTGT